MYGKAQIPFAALSVIDHGGDIALSLSLSLAHSWY